MINEQNPKNANEEEQLKKSVEIRFNELIKKPEIKEALNMFDNNEILSNFKYHNKNHTLDVIKETILFALADETNPDVLEKQVIAAAWHDVGYSEDIGDHEAFSVKLFEQSEAYKTLSEVNKKEIANSILDTKIYLENGSPSFSRTSSALGYVLDADVSNFGRDDFFEKRAQIAEELGVEWDNLKERKKFLKFTIYLLKKHDWKTQSARRLRQETKEKNLALMVEEYNQLVEQLKK